jgi:ketosteroid isomerase-like protein
MIVRTPTGIGLIKRLFAIVDTQNWQGMREIFSSQIVYERPGYPRLEGIERVLYFYENERILADGKHSLDRIVVDTDCAACWGRFVGHKKDGSAVNVGFADTYEFDAAGQICFRRSYFFEPSV